MNSKGLKSCLRIPQTQPYTALNCSLFLAKKTGNVLDSEYSKHFTILLCLSIKCQIILSRGYDLDALLYSTGDLINLNKSFEDFAGGDVQAMQFSEYMSVTY